jgi:hypothetical protein
MHTSGRLRSFLTLALVLYAAASAAWAQQDAATLREPVPAETPLKLTAGDYLFSGGAIGTDLNLRHGSDLGNVWLGYFQSDQLDIHQWRTGWDSTFGKMLRITPSVQLASQGFIGGSLQAETGETWFVGAGLGRTNLQPYWNLNFDPNDSYTLSAGYRGTPGQTLALQYVRDNRLNPDQSHLHLYWRQSLPERQRLTVDLLYKQGLVDDAMIARWGYSVTYDWPRFFLHVAFDPNANFASDDLWRFSVGAHF